MFPVASKGAVAEALPSDISSVLQRVVVGLLGLIVFACMHAVMYHLHYVLVPFFLSGFLVFALEPTVQRLYQSLAGRASPYRWFGCCMVRRWRRQQRDLHAGQDSEASQDDNADSEEDLQASEILLGEQVGVDWESYGIHILDCFCRFIAVATVLGAVLLAATLVIYMLANGALNIRSHWPAYEKGVQSWVAWFDQGMDGVAARLKLSTALGSQVKGIYTNILAKLQDTILELVNMIVTFVTGGVSFAVMVLLYMLFWLFQPLPIGGKTSALVQNYIWKKTLVAVLYGTSVGLLLFCLGVDLPTFFGLVSFCLYFVPEVGAFISMFAPIPLILLNASFGSPTTWVIVALVGQVVLKLLIGNLLEMRLLADDAEMSLHPVWVLLGLNYFGFLWGPVGMLISVPLLSLLKGIVLSTYEDSKDTQPYLAEWCDGVLACMEGRKRRDERRRRSAWLLPFVTPPLPSKEQIPQREAEEGKPQTQAASAAAAAVTGPKKMPQQETARAPQTDGGLSASSTEDL